MSNGLELLLTDISAYPEPIVLVIGILIPVGIGSPFVGVGVFLLWKSYKLIKKRQKLRRLNSVQIWVLLRLRLIFSVLLLGCGSGRF